MSIQTQHLNPSPDSFPPTSAKLRTPLNWNGGRESSPRCLPVVTATSCAPARKRVLCKRQGCDPRCACRPLGFHSTPLQLLAWWHLPDELFWAEVSLEGKEELVRAALISS